MIFFIRRKINVLLPRYLDLCVFVKFFSGKVLPKNTVNGYVKRYIQKFTPPLVLILILTLQLLMLRE